MNTDTPIGNLQPIKVMWLTGNQGFYRYSHQPSASYFVVFDEYNEQTIHIPFAGVMMVVEITEIVYQQAMEDIKQQAKGIKRPKLITPM